MSPLTNPLCTCRSSIEHGPVHVVFLSQYTDYARTSMQVRIESVMCMTMSVYMCASHQELNLI